MARPEAHLHLLAELAHPVGRPAPADLFERTVRGVPMGLLDEE